MGPDQPQPPTSTSGSHPSNATSKRGLFGSYLSSWTDTITEKASLTNLRQVQATYDPRQSLAKQIPIHFGMNPS